MHLDLLGHPYNDLCLMHLHLVSVCYSIDEKICDTKRSESVPVSDFMHNHKNIA